MGFEMGQTSNNKIQLFISFRGQDERLKLLPHLKYHLRGSKVNVFIDADNIGEPLENIFKHIRNSRIVIVIFSINYLESVWCLDELVHIRNCLMTEKIDFVVPVFYNVRASHVKNQTGDFGKKFLALQETHPGSIKKWTKALIFVANYGGLTYDKNGLISELDFVKAVVDAVNIVVTKISFKEGYNNSLISTKRTNGAAANLAKFNIDVDDILDMLYYYSEGLEALDLERQKQSLQDYNKGVYLKEHSRMHPTYIQESPWAFDDNLPEPQWPLFDYRRTNSFPDNIYQIYPPLSHETTMVQYHPDVSEVSNDNIQQDETIAVQNRSVTNQLIENQSPAATQGSIVNKLQRECSEKRDEDINCVMFMWYCFKLWLSRKKGGEREDLRVSS